MRWWLSCSSSDLYVNRLGFIMRTAVLSGRYNVCVTMAQASLYLKVIWVQDKEAAEHIHWNVTKCKHKP